jgi:hypothetical protein
MTPERLLKIIHDLKLEFLGKSVNARGKPLKAKGKLYKHGVAEAYEDITDRLQRLVNQIKQEMEDS